MLPITEAITPMPRRISGKITKRMIILAVEHGTAPGEIAQHQAQDERRDQRDLEALEHVGGHAGAVADVVAHEVGDHRRVARVVLGDAGLNLADQVGAHIGGLGVDAAAHAHKQRDQAAAEAEAQQRIGRGDAKHHEDQRAAQQAKTRPSTYQ